MAIKHWSATPLPDNVSYQAGAVATDACMTAYHAVVGTGDVQAGETIVIIGIGGLGFNGMQIAKARGARVIVRDNRKEVLEEAKKFGIADEDIVPTEKKLDEWVKEKGLLVDTIVDFAGKEETFEAAQNAGESLPWSFDCVR
jgi:alcohol dehydrogenase, propanol-preferring